MSKFNKRALVVAVVGALALPGIAAAATFGYHPVIVVQSTFAKDLIVNDGTTLHTPQGLTLNGSATGIDATNISAIAAGNIIAVKVTLTNGAKFDTTAPVVALVATFLEGTQTNGAAAGTALNVVAGSESYSASGQELNFRYIATAAGNPAGGAIVPPFFLALQGLHITNLVQGLGTGSSVGAEITAQNISAGGQQILAGRATIAKSKWGVTADSVASPDVAKRIDVAGCAAPAFNRKTRYSPNGLVGNACVAGAPTNSYFSAGGVQVDIARDTLTNSVATQYVNNYDANAANPQFNIVGTGKLTVTVTGTNFAAFAAGNAWLDNTNNCVGGAGTIPGVVTGGNTATFTASVAHPYWDNLAAVNPGPETVFVCLGVNGAVELVPQVLSATVSVDHDLPTQRVNPPSMDFDLLPLQLNGTTLTFQNVNPAANSTAQSFLRLTNNNADVCPVTIDAKDDAGVHSGSVTYTLAAHASTHFNSDQLENGGKAGATGSFGARTGGTGKWYVRVSAECSNFVGSALNRNFTDGTVTDLTAEKNNGATWLTP